MDSAELRVQLERYQRESYGWALRCCSRNALEAEVVLQAAYLKVLAGKARFEGKSTFKTWIFSVIRKTAADERRKKILRRLRLTKYMEREGQGAQDETPYEAIYRTEVQMLFRRALDELSKRQQEVLQLVFYHELSLAEAAEVMGVSVGSARTHYDRGKKQLRQRMAESRAFDELELGRRKTQGTIP